MYIYRPEVDTYTPVHNVVLVDDTASRVGARVYFPGVTGSKFSRNNDTFYVPEDLRIENPAIEEPVVFLQPIWKDGKYIPVAYGVTQKVDTLLRPQK